MLIFLVNYYKIFYSVCNSYNCIKEEKKIIEKKINNKVKYSVLPKNFIYDDNIIYPLSLHSKTFVIGANENNYLPHFFTDRYGFINDDKFYDKNMEVPDYDFFSINALDDAKNLADIYYSNGYIDVEAKAGVHFGTYKVFVNFIPVADITSISKEIFNNLKNCTCLKCSAFILEIGLERWTPS